MKVTSTTIKASTSDEGTEDNEALITSFEQILRECRERRSSRTCKGREKRRKAAEEPENGDGKKNFKRRIFFQR